MVRALRTEVRTALRMFSQILERKGAKCLDENEKDILSNIKDSAIRLTHLVNELLSFSKMAQDDMHLEKINTLEMVNHEPSHRLANFLWSPICDGSRRKDRWYCRRR